MTQYKLVHELRGTRPSHFEEWAPHNEGDKEQPKEHWKLIYL